MCDGPFCDGQCVDCDEEELSPFEEELEEYPELLKFGVDRDVLEEFFNDLGTLEHFGEMFEGSYIGDSEEEAVGELYHDEYQEMERDLPFPFRYNTDWWKVGNDGLRGGDYFTIYEGLGKYAIFNNSH